MLKLADFGLRGGLIKGERINEVFREQFVESEFSDLPIPLAAVATDLHTGQEVWLREGRVAAAIAASIAVPGLFRPVRHEDRYLVDGSVVNPIPVSLCRAMGADIVLAVDLGSDLVGRYVRDNDRLNPAGSFMSRVFPRYNPTSDRQAEPDVAPPSLIETLVGAINIMQLRIARSRLAGEPPDVLVTPRLGHLGLLDYHRAKFAIAEGRDEVTRMLPAIRNAIPA
jgi:NTE family protein